MKTAIKKSMLIVATLIATLSYAKGSTSSNSDEKLKLFTFSIKECSKRATIIDY